MKMTELKGYDVLVAGGGPSGFCAAVESARSGAKTLLVEATGSLGGMASSGLVPGWCGFHDGEKFIHRGLAKEVLDGLHLYAGKNPSDDIKKMGSIDAEALKMVLDRMAMESGVDVLFFTTLAGVETGKGGLVKEAVIASKEGLFAVSAKLFIDCTGDADLCHFAGAKTVKGDDDGDMQPVTLCHAIVNIHDVDMATALPKDYRERIMADPKYNLIKDSFWGPWKPYSGIQVHNGGHLWKVDGTDVRSVSKAMREGRLLAKQLRDAMAEYIPAMYKDSWLLQTASLLGVRETRRIVGEYVLSVEDYHARRRFKDDISFNSFFIDIHPSQAKRAREDKGDWSWEKEKRDSRYKPGEFQGIPYRCLLPQGLKNVIDAGRSVSSDRASQSAIRVMPPCMTMGQAAGAAAALLIKQGGKDFRDVDTDALRAKLKSEGAFLP